MEDGEWRRTWEAIPYIGGANGIEINPPDDAGGWQLLQTIHIPPETPKGKNGEVLLGSMVHVWFRPLR